MVKEAKERIKPALDDDFARDHGEFETLEDLKESIRKEVRGFLEEETRRDLENQIIEVLIEKHALEVPEALVERQISIIVEEGQRRLIARGVDPVRIPPPTQGQRDQVRPSAEKTVKAGLILKAISEKEGLQVSEKELQEEIARRAEVLEYSPDHLRDELEARNLLHDVRSAILQRKVFDLLKEHAEIEEAAPNEGPPEEKQEVE
jgi:trigger factor